MYQDIKEQFETDGFAVVKNFLNDKEIEKMTSAMNILDEKKPKSPTSVFSTIENKKTQGRDDYYLESNDKISYFFEATENGENIINKIGHGIHYLEPTFKEITFSEKIKNLCQGIGLTDPAVVHSMIIFKKAGFGGEVNIHQDATYVSTDPETVVAFWFPLVDVTIDNGCLWFAKGSHKNGLLRSFIKNPDKESAEKMIYDKPRPSYEGVEFEPVLVQKGDCVIINSLVLHKSERNLSKKDRPIYCFHVAEKWAKYSPLNWIQPSDVVPFVSLYA